MIWILYNLFIMAHNRETFCTIWWWKTALSPTLMCSLVILDILGRQSNLICVKLRNRVKWCSLSCMWHLCTYLSIIRQEDITLTPQPNLACLLGSSKDTALNPKSWVPAQLGALLIFSHKMEIWVEFTLMGFLAHVDRWDEERPTVIAEPLPAPLWLESSFCCKYSPGPQVCPWNHGEGEWLGPSLGGWPKEASLLFDTKWERKDTLPRGQREGNKARKKTKCFCIWGFEQDVFAFEVSSGPVLLWVLPGFPSFV